MAYIDKDLLLKDIGESVVFSVKNGGVSPELRGARKIIDRIQVAPTADVVEVRHGEWIEDGYFDNPCVCSYCGAEAPYVSHFDEQYDYDWEENLEYSGLKVTNEYIKTPYCPHCGAKMEGGKEE